LLEVVVSVFENVHIQTAMDLAQFKFKKADASTQLTTFDTWQFTDDFFVS
jgi:hypothetical protein